MLQSQVRRLSLRTAIMLPFATLMLVSVALMGYAAHVNHERLLTEQSQRVIGGLTARTIFCPISWTLPTPSCG